MKKIISTTLLATLGLTLFAPTAFATTADGVTKTDAGFAAGGGEGPVIPVIPDPNEPDPDPIIPPTPGPNPIVGGVTLTYMPIISFGGDNKISVQETNYQALTEEINTVSGKKYYAPSFVQVADASGENKKWSVTVQQTENYKLENDTKTLNNTRIRVYGNTVGSEDSVKLNDIAGLVKGAGGYAVIPTTADNSALTVISTKDTSQGVSGSIYNSVFADNYKAQDYYTKAGVVTTLGATQGRYSGVQLNVPKGEDIKKGNYEGKLTWTLTVTP